jgi:hypothetical protein
MSNVMEMDPQCIPRDDYSVLRFVIGLCHPHVPNHIGVHTCSGRDIILLQVDTTFWPFAE